MSSSTSHFDLPVTRRRLSALLDGWGAVTAQIHLDAYLIRQKRFYEALFRQTHYPLPSDVIIAHGEVTCIPNLASESLWGKLHDDPTSEDALARFQNDMERQQIAQDLDRHEAEDARLTHRFLVVDEEIEVHEAEEFAAIFRGVVRGKRTSARYAGYSRRPRLSFPWLPVLRYTVTAAMIVVEAFQLSLPFLDFLGVDTSNLPAEWTRNPLGVLGGAGFALTATAGLCSLWHLLISSAVAIARNWDTAGPGKTGLRLVGLLILSCGLVYGTFVIANMRHSLADYVSTYQGTQQGMGNSVFVFLTFLLPAASAYLLHKIGHSQYRERRADIHAARAQLDRDEDERLLAGERRADAMDLLRTKRAWIEEQRAQLRAKRLALAERAHNAERGRRERLKHARLATETFVRTLLAALEMDRYYFLRAAHRCQAMHLVPEKARGHSRSAPMPPRQSIRAFLTAGRNGHET
jgi:hypothetical protein